MQILPFLFMFIVQGNREYPKLKMSLSVDKKDSLCISVFVHLFPYLFFQRSSTVLARSFISSLSFEETAFDFEAARA